MAVIEWVNKGQVTICPNGKPSFPDVPSCPGLYRITLADGRTYIGEGKNLCRRLSDYRHPTKGNEGEHVMRYELSRAGGGRLEIFPTPALVERRERHALERAEIKAAVERGERLLNDEGPPCELRLRAKIAYHEAQIVALQLKLAELGGAVTET